MSDSILGAIQSNLSLLAEEQLRYVSAVIEALATPPEIEVGGTDLSAEWLAGLGETIQLHHLHSLEPFTKDKFEYAVVRLMLRLGIPSEKVENGHPGEDVVVGSERWSLKTQADRQIRRDQVLISKFMELGRGAWVTEEDLGGLRDRMLEHLGNYDRIFSLRCLTPRPSDCWEYELVEIPRQLLLASSGLPCEMAHGSRQTPKPGRCFIRADGGDLLAELYFDGGSERKLRVQKIALDACIVHARWKFSVHAED